jgi:8-oxo-dGTP pyrophosphatase MutT (NUDIX family)
MDFTQKIYCNNKPLVVTNNSAAYLQAHPTAADYLLFTGAVVRNFQLALQHLEKDAAPAGAIIEVASAHLFQQEIQKLCRPIDAGGGVVFNENGAVLLIFRQSKWDLPKGKRDEGEAIEACALREVSEETGLQGLQLGEKICDTYHVYALQNELLLKRTSWYKMLASSTETLLPQQAENIMEARWVLPPEMPPMLLHTYETIKNVLQAAGVH